MELKLYNGICNFTREIYHPKGCTKEFVRNFQRIMQNKPKVKYAKNNISSFVISKYKVSGHLVIRKTNPIQSQNKPIFGLEINVHLGNKPKQTQFSSELKNALKIHRFGINWTIV